YDSPRRVQRLRFITPDTQGTRGKRMKRSKQQLFPSVDEGDKPVECLGLTFPSEKARREFFLEKLRQKLQDPKFRQLPGFPDASDDDILALSDPPYYTACPNPFIEDFINHYGKPYEPGSSYSKEPLAVDVTEGKNDPLYRLPSYHTK